LPRRLMVIEGLLSPTRVIVGLRCADSRQLIDALSSIAAEDLDISTSRVSDRLLDRERLGSTGLGNGVALPHARFEELQNPIGVFARLQRPIGFNAIDGRPVDLVFLLLSPSSREHLTVLASVARQLRSVSIASELRKAASADEIIRLLRQN
jgi:nitrogen PTS system EIIA component